MEKLYRNVLHIKLVIPSQMEVNFLPYFKDMILPFLFYEVPRERFIKGRLRAQGSLKRWGSLNKKVFLKPNEATMGVSAKLISYDVP